MSRVGLCVPTGPLTSFHDLPSVCRCGALLRTVRMAPTVNDWHEVDDQGRVHIDEAPEGLREDPKRWWAELFERSPQAYSTLKAAVAFGHHSWFHIHRADRHALGPTPLPPFCHGSPMWASPDGWQCRVMRRLFAYREDVTT